MNGFFSPKGHDHPDTALPSPNCLHAPATARNKDALLHVLTDHLPTSGTILELASGTGEHACHFARHLPFVTWQPSDIEPHHLASIRAWRDYHQIDHMADPVHLDATEDWPPLDNLRAICAINLIHIAPWPVAQALMNKAGKLLNQAEDMLFLYGPYKQKGDHTAPSNADFDISLRRRNAQWGVRDMEAVVDLAKDAGFKAPDIIPMPANNFSLIFRK